MKRAALITAASTTAVVVLASVTACSGGGKTASSSTNGTFTLGISQDPGKLDPQRSNASVNGEIAVLAYDTAVRLDKSNQLQPGVVSKWSQQDPTTWKLTVRSGVTCSDGSPMDAKTVADNLNFVANPKNASPLAGLTIPPKSTATADNATHTVTVKLPSPSAFLMQNLTLLPLVCEHGLTDRASLASSSQGSGPYVISSVTPGDQIDYKLRKGYTWGPPGSPSTSAHGLPSKVVVKIVSNATTTANLLLNGQLNVASVTGADQKRVQAAGLYSVGTSGLSDQVYFNHAAGLPTESADVRKALVMGLNMKQVIPADTGGLGTPATGLLGTPKICPGNTLKGNLPGYDPAAAKKLLDQAGWTVGQGGIRSKGGKKLSLKLSYSSDQTGASSAAQVVATDWKQLGAQVTLHGQAAQQLVSGMSSGTLSWDTAVYSIGVLNPAQFLPFLSGPVPPKGQNLSAIDNKQYNSLVAKASTEPGTKGCADWNAAETSLFKNADIAPTGQIKSETFGKNATFELSGNGQFVPTTFRLR